MTAHKNKLDIDEVRTKLKVKDLKLQRDIAQKHPATSSFLNQKLITAKSLREKSANILRSGVMAGTILLNIGKVGSNLPTPTDLIKNSLSLEKDKIDKKEKNTPKAVLADALKSVLPQRVRPLDRTEEKLLENVVSQMTGVKVKTTLEGEHLNTVYGLIGIEQHLRRYPGDTLSNHGSYSDQKEGMAPGLGAWGYFSPSKEKLSEELVQKEKWYAVVQTLYLHDWNRRQPFLRDWYKYRKVLIVNTKNGNAVVAAIADSGPAAWTGKSFGGSPEVMDHLGGDRYTKGEVLVFFVDDPENKIGLGPIDYDKVDLDNIALR